MRELTNKQPNQKNKMVREQINKVRNLKHEFHEVLQEKIWPSTSLILSANFSK